MRTIRWGIVGCGNVTEVKSGPGFQKARGSALVAVMRRDGAKAADYAKRHGVARWYDDGDALINGPEVDAVYVATPPGSHEQYAMKALAAGKPCYVEKPMARNAAEARRMAAAFAAAGVPLFVAYYRRALPRFLKAKEVIDGGGLGAIREVTYTYRDAQVAGRIEPEPWRLKADEAGGGLFLDMGSHAIDMLDYWFGPVTVGEGGARNVAGTHAVEDAVEFGFTCGGGRVKGRFSVRHYEGKEDLFVVKGERGELRMSCFGNEPVAVRYADGRAEAFDLPNPPHVAQPLIQTVVDELLGVGRCASTAPSGVRAQEVMDRALEGYYGGREDGFWKRGWPGAEGDRG
jgi:predicted dehydrogenase